MRKVVVFTICICFTKWVCCQIAYHDALVLRKEAKKVQSSIDVNEVAGILTNYLPKRFRDSDALKTISFFKENNPFFTSYFNFGVQTGKGGPIKITDIPTFLPPAIGATNITTIADGLAKFLVQRTKEELSVAFFREFRTVLNDPKYEDLRTLFPETASLLNLIDQNIYQFSMYLTNLKDAFGNDLVNLPESFSYVLHQPKYQNFFDQHPELLQVFQIAAQTSDLIIKKDKLENAGEIIENLGPDTFFGSSDPVSKDINASIKTLQLISKSFNSIDTSKKQYWVSADSAFLVLRDTVTFRIYMGLLYAQADTIVFARDSLQNILRKLADNVSVDKLRTNIYGFYIQLNSYNSLFHSYNRQIAESPEDLIQNLSPELKKDSSSLLLFGIINSSLNIIESGMSLARGWSKNVSDLSPYISAFKDVNQLILYCNQQRYILAVTSLVKATDEILKEAFKQNHNNVNYLKFIHHLNLYGTFITQVATAKSSDEVSTIIEKTVLPTGSAYIKKHSIFNLSLNAYTGLYGGRQRQATDEKFVSVAGVYAPIGIAASWGLPRGDRNKEPWSISFFASIIDLGPLVTYRFTNYNDTLANDVSVRLGQVLSPGAHLILGLPKWPVSIGGGFDWSPLLTKVEKTKVTVLNSDKRPLRWEIFVAVDIPFLNFYNKPR